MDDEDRDMPLAGAMRVLAVRLVAERDPLIAAIIADFDASTRAPIPRTLQYSTYRAATTRPTWASRGVRMNTRFAWSQFRTSAGDRHRARGRGSAGWTVREVRDEVIVEAPSDDDLYSEVWRLAEFIAYREYVAIRRKSPVEFLVESHNGGVSARSFDARVCDEIAAGEKLASVEGRILDAHSQSQFRAHVAELRALILRHASLR